jgi:hypothetical protein
MRFERSLSLLLFCLRMVDRYVEVVYDLHRRWEAKHRSWTLSRVAGVISGLSLLLKLK